jgi:hypothetical protein
MVRKTKVKKINKDNFFSEKTDKMYTKKLGSIIQIRKNFHPPKNAEKDELYIENEKNDYIKYSSLKQDCLNCYFYEDENKCSNKRRKKCSKDKACFIKIEEYEFLFNKFKNTQFNNCNYLNLKNQLKKIGEGDYFILED